MSLWQGASLVPLASHLSNLAGPAHICNTSAILDCLTPRNWAAYANVSSSLKCACFCLLHLSLQYELLRFYMFVSLSRIPVTKPVGAQGPDAKVTKF